MKRANEALVVDIPPNMFITCFYAVLDPETGRLRYANAGHDLPYLRRGADVEELRARGIPLGLMPRGKKVMVTAMAMHRIVGGKIAEEWSEDSGSAEVAQAHLDQEIRERERVEQDLRACYELGWKTA